MRYRLGSARHSDKNVLRIFLCSFYHLSFFERNVLGGLEPPPCTSLSAQSIFRSRISTFVHIRMCFKCETVRCRLTFLIAIPATILKKKRGALLLAPLTVFSKRSHSSSTPIRSGSQTRSDTIHPARCPDRLPRRHYEQFQ